MAAIGNALGIPFLKRGNGVSHTYATWNQADADPSIVVDSGGLIISRSGVASWASVRADQSVTSGKWYWEITPNTSSGYIILGVANASQSLATYAGATADGWAYYGLNGNQAHAGLSAYGATFTDGDVIGVALDMDGDTLEFFKNNVSQGVIDVSTMTGAIYPIASLYFDQTNYATANFGATALAYAPPSGFNSGLYI